MRVHYNDIHRRWLGRLWQQDPAQSQVGIQLNVDVVQFYV